MDSLCRCGCNRAIPCLVDAALVCSLNQQQNSLRPRLHTRLDVANGHRICSGNIPLIIGPSNSIRGRPSCETRNRYPDITNPGSRAAG
jgi:hypothetical protein